MDVDGEVFLDSWGFVEAGGCGLGEGVCLERVG